MRMLSSTRLALLALLACLVVAIAPGAASAAAGSGGVTLGVGGTGKAARALKAAGVQVGAISPAKKRGARVVLPVRSISVGKSATVALRGGVAFRAGKRSLRLKAVRLTLTAKRATVSAKAGQRRLAVFAAELPRGRAKLDRSKVTAKLTGTKLALTAKAASLLRTKLAVAGVRAGALGQLAVDAGPRGGSGGGGGGTKPGPGGPGAGNPQSGPIRNEPPVLPRPATAVDVSGISIAWYPRDSWVRYLTSATGAGDGIFASDGATKLAPMTTPDHPCSDAPYAGSGSFDYGFSFTPKGGWYDPPTGSAAIYGQGGVKFKWRTHTIDLTASDPEIELDPSNPRTVFRFNGSDGTAYPNQRAVLTKLDLTGRPTVVGNTRSYTATRGVLTDDGAAVFAGFYPPADGFGCVTVSFTTP